MRAPVLSFIQMRLATKSSTNGEKNGEYTFVISVKNGEYEFVGQLFVSIPYMSGSHGCFFSGSSSHLWIWLIVFRVCFVAILSVLIRGE
jgi:hypothetical protein